MAQKIGYNDGLDWLVGFLKKFPLVKYRPVGERPASLSAWYGLEKIERTLRILKDDHDAAIVSPAPPPPPPPPPPPDPPPVLRLAPQTWNRGSSGQDARYCTRDSGNPDPGGFHYDADGRSLGGRSGKFVPGPKPADEMDGREPCDPYNGMPPWPPESYEV